MLELLKKIINKYKKKIIILFLTFIIVTTIFAIKQFYEICYKNYYLTVVGIIDHVDGLGRQISDFENLVGDQIEMNSTAYLRNSTNLTSSLKKILEIKNKKLGYVVLNEFIFPFSFEDENSFCHKIIFYFL